MAEAPKLKDYFTEDVVRSIGDRLATHHRTFDVDRFVGRVMAPDDGEPFDTLEFTARSRRIADGIEATADLDPVALMDLLVRSLPPVLDAADGSLNEGFSLWPYGEVIARHGAEHPAEGLAASYELTQRFTSEFAIRPILAHHPDALATVAQWATDPSEHVRRLASEGTRPRLPWAQRLSLPVDEVLAILSTLRADESAYVRKSVANHLNDLAKEHPERIIAMLADWHREAEAAGIEETQWIVRHALRNHLKAGTPAALAIFGYEEPQLEVRGLAATPASVAIGDDVEFSFVLESTATGADDQLLMVDLVMGYRKANDSVSPKVFKFRELHLETGAQQECSKRFAMVERSTRRLYPGEHSLTVRVNGQDLATTTFDLNG